MDVLSLIRNKIRGLPLYVKLRRYGLMNTIRRLYCKRLMARMGCVSLANQSTAQPGEVHILTSKWDWDLALWALHSFYHWASIDWPLIVHDGGGLGPHEWSCFKTHFPNARLVPASQADLLVNHWLAERDLSATIHARANYNLMRKIIDTAVVCQAPRYILLDSDVLFFRTPTYLLHLVHESNQRFHILRDYQDSYSIDQETALVKLGVSLPNTINTGLAIIPKSAVDFEAMETIFRKEVIPLDRDGFAEQTILALLASLAGFKYLPEDYKVVTGLSNSTVDTFRHYVGPVKHLFFDEGVPHFRKMING
jgi:hypothetical protein